MTFLNFQWFAATHPEPPFYRKLKSLGLGLSELNMIGQHVNREDMMTYIMEPSAAFWCCGWYWAGPCKMVIELKVVPLLRYWRSQH